MAQSWITVQWVESWDYLGINVVSGKRYGCSVSDRIQKFYRCANGIFRVEGKSDDETMLRLVESHCVPILTYGMEVANFSDHKEKSRIRAAYNSLFRKIFGYRRFESVTDLQLSLGRPTWEMLLEQRKMVFTVVCRSVELTPLCTYLLLSELYLFISYLFIVIRNCSQLCEINNIIPPNYPQNSLFGI